MSKDGSSGESGAQDSGDNAGDVKDVNASLYEDKGPKKIVRIITVMAYMFSVSFVAIVLSAYYVFLWEPPNPRLMHSPAIRLRADPRLDFLRIESPPEQHLETISRHSSSKRNNSNERIQEHVKESTLGNNDLEEFATTLKTTLAEELIHERNNDNYSSSYSSSSSSIQEYLIKHNNRDNEDDNMKENKKINLPWKNLRQNYNLKQSIVIDREGERKDKMNETIFMNKIMYNNLMEKSERKHEEDENKEKKTQIGKTTTAKSITTNETTDETSEMSTTLREKSLLQILTGTTKTKEIFPYTSSSSIASKESRMIDVVTTTKSYKEDKSRN
ncbi:PREDICTED: uncharacterized protein LOC107072529 [Polistes dominula]|uniref:Uncharacterized protein LOC107072529 n=1 Tax=Polistes dominula TaxID=743375 RepID=A0ABM1J6D4_POLDO|nr:PREDICTED: uncharacterized protein LOC107072529 [Polistes dominula]